MNHNQSDECPECPLCMELLEMDDINFFPCTCGYQICRFCWHRLRTDENGLCPACRKPYTESPADYKPLTQEELQKIKQEKKQKELIRKQKVTENRKHLSNVRVVQKNLVFVVGLSSRLADAEALKKMEYFGKFGKIHKVVINHTTSYAGSQGPSASAYVTYQRAEDALKAISQVNNIHVDGRTLKVSLGTTKYCSHFMKNQQCPKNDCMYLHELGDEAASFTKEEMQQGKHQEFEKKLQEHYLGVGSTKNGGIGGLSGSTGTESSHSSGRRTHKDSLSESNGGNVGGSSSSRNGRTSATINGICASNNSSNISGGSFHTAGIQPLDSIVISPGEGWPSLNLGGSKDLGSNYSGSSSGVSSASGSQNSVNSNSSGSSNQGKKNRKHNGSNSNVINGSTGCATSSPRNTPTRDHQNTGRRGQNEDSASSSGRSTAARASPCPSSAASSESSASSLSSVLSTTPPASSSPSDLTPAKRKQATSRSPVSAHVQRRQKSQSPSSNRESQFDNGLADSNTNLDHSDLSNDSYNPTETQNVPGNHEPISIVDTDLEKSDEILITEVITTEREHDQSPETRAEDVSEPSFLRDVTPPADAANDPFHDHIITSLNNVVDSHETTQQLSSASLHSGDWDIGDRTEQPLSVNATCATADIWSNTTKACESIDDELGFDPFEETNKALAQDIIMEKQKEQLQRHQLHEQQRQQQQSFHQLQQLRQQVDSQNGHAGLKAFMSSGGESLGGIGAARLPPPGFNGVVTSIHNVSNNVSRNRVDINKLFSGISSSLGNNLSNQSPQLNGLISNRLPHGPPPGMSMLSNLQGHQPGLDPSAGRSGVSTNPLLAALEASSAHSLAQQQPGPPPGLSLPKQDSFAMKDLENAFPTLTSLNRMNSLNTLESSTNALNPSLSSFSNVNGLASLNGLSLSSLNNGGLGLNFCNLNAPQQQNSLSQLNAFSGMNLAQAQQQSVNTPGNNVISNLFNFSQPSQVPQQSILHQLALHNSHKGWTNNSNGAPDLTALDPAIVSSGQLTDSRSDSPPEWLRLMDGPASTWSSLLPTQNQQTPNSSTLSQQQHLGTTSGFQATLSSQQQVSLLQHQQQQQHHQQQLAAFQQLRQQQQQAIPSVWPPTSPPPGFSSLSPLHRAKLSHKLDNM
ncbi:probable WRKY transcription factor protein 1 [Hyalella azteca]|uniref:CCR4-NOT transcription complex subunit 4 n=1 Tax=Hyalella azteca TaxID=294128 RepID=A0A8B7PSM8_HYAAZ|nr:probable WRKY transcription factor protein 1 [Hyalella azteca]XP_047737972.1 probable WRKY transcription factor protein 1 [Hyalella azteca]